MNELIEIKQYEFDGEYLMAISCKELYEFLKLDKSHYTRWVKRNIINNKIFTENSDWVGFAQEANGNETTDYAITIEFAKRLAMMTKSEKGEEVRTYFLNCEKAAKQNNTPKIPQSFAEALQLAADQAKALELQAPKVAYFDAIVERNLLTNIRETAKEIHVKEKLFVKWLIDNGYLYRNAANQLKPYAQYSGVLFEIKDYVNPNNGKVGNQTLVTPKGKETFRLLLSSVKLN